MTATGFKIPLMLSLLLSTLTSLTTAYPQNAEPFRPNEKMLLQRQTSGPSRGWAVRAIDSCPSGTSKCDGAGGMTVCCPTDTVCYTGATSPLSGKYAMCCLPGDKDQPSTSGDEDQYCFDRLKELPVCANSADWTLWIGTSVSANHHPFCCPDGQVGYVGTDYYPSCAERGTPIPAGRSATTIAQATRAVSASASRVTASGAPSSATGTTRTGSRATSTPEPDASGDSSPDTGSNSENGVKVVEKKQNIGAIIGGVFGGLGGLALIWLIWKIFNRLYPKQPKQPPPASAGGVVYADGGRAELDDNGVPKAPPPYVTSLDDTYRTHGLAQVAGNRSVSPLEPPPASTAPAHNSVADGRVEMPGNRVENTNTGGVSLVGTAPAYSTGTPDGVMFEVDGRPIERP